MTEFDMQCRSCGVPVVSKPETERDATARCLMESLHMVAVLLVYNTGVRPVIKAATITDDMLKGRREELRRRFCKEEHAAGSENSTYADARRATMLAAVCCLRTCCLRARTPKLSLERSAGIALSVLWVFFVFGTEGFGTLFTLLIILCGGVWAGLIVCIRKTDAQAKRNTTIALYEIHKAKESAKIPTGISAMNRRGDQQ